MLNRPPLVSADTTYEPEKLHTMDEMFELQIHSVAVGSARHWALYAVPSSEDGFVERVDCPGLEELDDVLTKLAGMGMNDTSLKKAQTSIIERNVSCVLGSCLLSPDQRTHLGLEPVSGLTAGDIKHLLSDQEGPQDGQ